MTMKNVCEPFNTSGNLSKYYGYAPFGAVSSSSGTNQPFQWSSEVYDSELDLVYYNYRHYSPSLGRFLSRDPIEEQGGLNLYSFVRNSSAWKWDVLGLITSLQACFTNPSMFACCLQTGILSWGSITAKYAGKSGSKKLIKLLESWGGKVVKGGKGSHTKIQMPNRNVVIVPQAPANGTVKSILKSAIQE